MKQFTTIEQIANISQSYKNKQSDFNIIAIPSIDKIDFFKFDEIIYLKSDGRYTNFYLKNGKNVLATRNIGEYEKLFSENIFFRIHHSYIVNLAYVEKITKETGYYCEMVNSHNIPIAKRKQDQLLKFIGLK